MYSRPWHQLLTEAEGDIIHAPINIYENQHKARAGWAG